MVIPVEVSATKLSDDRHFGVVRELSSQNVLE